MSYKKEGVPEIREGFLQRMVQEIIEGTNQLSFPMLVVHGGGSITHPLLDQYGVAKVLKKGLVSKPSQILAAARIHQAMEMLNSKIVEVFHSKKMPAWHFQTSALMLSSQRKIKSIFLDAVWQSLQKGYIPILHGDLNIDAQVGSSVCSGDMVACLLAKELGAGRVLFASDVDGIYAENPNQGGDFEYYDVLRISDFKMDLMSDDSKDHSGGMLAKLRYIDEHCQDKEVVIFNGITKGNIKKALRGEKIGTKVV